MHSETEGHPVRDTIPPIPLGMNWSLEETTISQVSTHLDSHSAEVEEDPHFREGSFDGRCCISSLLIVCIYLYISKYEYINIVI
jgi:hypothetical protein